MRIQVKEKGNTVQFKKNANMLNFDKNTTSVLKLISLKVYIHILKNIMVVSKDMTILLN